MLKIKISQYHSPKVVYASCKVGGGGTTCGHA